MEQSLKSRMLRSATWLIGSSVSSQLLRLASNLVLTRLLIPADFGLVAAVSTLYFALVMFSDFGIWQSVVKSPDGTAPRYLGTAWLVQLLRGALLAGIVLLVAATLQFGDVHAWFEANSAYADSRLPALMTLFALSALLQGLESMNLALAQRELKVDRLARLEMLSQIGGIVITLVLAWLFRSVWALALGSVAGTLIRTLMSHRYLQGPVIKPCWDRLYAAEILGFGKWIFISSIVGFVAANGERILLAGTLSATLFGVFSIAATMLAAVTGVYGSINAHIVYAGLSHVTRNDSPAEAQRVHARLQRIADLLLGGLAGVLFMSGSWIITLLYDPRYHDAGWMLQWLALGLIALRYQIVEQLMFAHGKPQWVTANNVIRALLLGIGIPLGYQMAGTQGAIIAVVISQFGSWPLSILFKAREGLLHWRTECLWLPALILGSLCGWGLDSLFRAILL